MTAPPAQCARTCGDAASSVDTMPGRAIEGRACSLRQIEIHGTMSIHRLIGTGVPGEQRRLTAHSTRRSLATFAAATPSLTGAPT